MIKSRRRVSNTQELADKIVRVKIGKQRDQLLGATAALVLALSEFGVFFLNNIT